MIPTTRVRHRRLRAVSVAVGLIGLTAMSVGPAAAVDPLAAGDSVAGPGAYDPNVSISSPGGAVFIVEGETPAAYGAANDDLDLGIDQTKNGCLGGDGVYGDGTGFADSTRVHDYEFTLKETVSDFSLRMLDFGDFNPTGATSHTVVMTAYDIGGDPVDADTLTFGTNTAVNPGTMWDAGDACTAALDNSEPGNYVFGVSGAGIAKVTLEVTEGPDPNIAFTDLDYTVDGQCVVNGTMTADLLAGQTTDAGDVSVYYDAATGQLVVTLTTTGGWVMTETHVDVVDDPGLFAMTNKGNPIPGHFEDSKTHDPAVTTYTYEVDWDGSMPAFVAAHAALVQLNSDGPFWASAVMDSSLGGRTAVDNAFRLLPASALGAPNGEFFSLGIAGDFDNVFSTSGTYEGGTLDVAFDGMIWNGPGDDVSVHEVTGGRAGYPEERAEVWALYDGSWTMLGIASSKDANGESYFDLGALPFAEQIRLVDITAMSGYNAGGVTGYDGFDVDAVDASVLMVGEETGWGDGTPFPGRNWATHLEYDPVCVWPDA